jgi:hypothetical protein
MGERERERERERTFKCKTLQVIAVAVNSTSIRQSWYSKELGCDTETSVVVAFLEEGSFFRPDILISEAQCTDYNQVFFLCVQTVEIVLINFRLDTHLYLAPH